MDYRKMNMEWSLSYKSVVKSIVKKYESHNMTLLYPYPCLSIIRDYTVIVFMEK